MCISFQEMSIYSLVSPGSQNATHIVLQLHPCLRGQRIPWVLLLPPPPKTELYLCSLSPNHCGCQKPQESHKCTAVAGINHKERDPQRNVFVRATISKAPLKHVPTANAYEAPDLTKQLNKFTVTIHSTAMSKPNQF